MKKHIIILALLVLIASCNDKENSKEITITEFPVQSELSAKVITIPPLAMNPYNMLITNNKLILFNMKKDTIFDVFHLPECNFLYSCGYKGEGPNDFLGVDRRSMVATPNGFKVLFQHNQVLKEVSVDEHKIWIDKKRNKAFKLDQNPINGFLPVNDSVYVYWSGFEKETEYNVVNYNTNQTISVSSYPKWTTAEKEENKLFTYVKNSVASPDGRMFASFYGYFKRFRIYNDQGQLLKDVSVEIPPFNDDLENEVQDRTIYYNSYPKASGKYIYTLCKSGKSTDTKESELQVWKWDGTPVASYKLDRVITLFAIFEKEQKIYAIDGENEDMVYMYQLPGSMK